MGGLSLIERQCCFVVLCIGIWPGSIGVARILSGGALLWLKKLTFLVVTLEIWSKYICKSYPPSKSVLKLSLALARGVLRVLGVHLHFSPVNYACNNFFSPPWGCSGGRVQVQSLHPLATSMPRSYTYCTSSLRSDRWSLVELRFWIAAVSVCVCSCIDVVAMSNLYRNMVLRSCGN